LPREKQLAAACFAQFFTSAPLKPGSRAGPTALAEYESSIITETPQDIFKFIEGLNDVRKEEKNYYTRLQEQ
jgi:hypothetical protein